MKDLSLFLLLMFIVSCNKEVSKDDKSDIKIETSEKKDVTEKYVFQKVAFWPEEKSFTQEGIVVFNNDTLQVASEYTDNVDYAEPTSDIYNNKGVYNYREMLIHFINNKTLDTITLKRETFKEFTDPQEYDRMLLQSVSLNNQTKKGTIPLIICLCKTESDICDYYNITIENGKVEITEFKEGDFIED